MQYPHRRCSSVGEHWARMHRALGSIPSTAKKRKKKVKVCVKEQCWKIERGEKEETVKWPSV